MRSKIKIRFEIIFLTAMIFFTKSAFSQQFDITYTLSNPNNSSVSSNDAMAQVVKQQNAFVNNLYVDYRRQLYRFDRKLIVSANVVKKMNLNNSKAAKYPYTKALYERSLKNYKQLEEISQKAATNAKQNKSIKELQDQQNRIIEKALDDYHKAEDLIELGENKSKIINEAIQRLTNEYHLSVAEKAELKKEIDKINFAKSQIRKLRTNTDALKDSKVDLEIKAAYQTVAQSLVSVSNIIQKVLEALNPNKKANDAIEIVQTVGDKFIEEHIENGKSPDVAISEAFKKGYEKLRQQEILKKTPEVLRKTVELPLFINEFIEEIKTWEKIEKSHREAFNSLNEILKLTNDAINLNEKLITRSTANTKVIIERSINTYLKKTKLQ